MSMPRMIFFDTMVLESIGTRLENVDFASLLDLGLPDIEFCVPEVCWREYLWHRESQLRACIDSMRKLASSVAKFGIETPEASQITQRLEQHLESLRSTYDEKAKQLGLRILPLPVAKISLDRLLNMSVSRIPPFEEHSGDGKKSKEKGFRDALAMFTILCAIETQPEMGALFVTGDENLRKGFEDLLPEYKTDAKVLQNLKEALSFVQKALTVSAVTRLREESQSTKQQLLEFRADLAEKVAQMKQISTLSIAPRTLGDVGLRQGDIQRVVSLSFQDVESAFWKDKDKDESRILFRLRCIARAFVSEAQVLPVRDCTLEIGSEQARPLLWSLPRDVEKDIPFSMYGEAVLERKEESWHLKEIRLDSGSPSPFEMLQLIIAS